jgi:cell division protease FtsH
MCSALGGRAAEETVLGTISTGAMNDLEKVTKQAYAMVTYFGMNEKLGNISFYDSSGQSEFAFSKPYSEKTAEVIDEEVRILISEQYERAKKILTENKEKHRELAEILLEREVIFSEDLERIFGKRKRAHFIEEEDSSAEALPEGEKAKETKTDEPDKVPETEKPEKEDNSSVSKEEVKAEKDKKETENSEKDKKENKS